MNSHLLQNIFSLEASLSKKENNGIKKEIATTRISNSYNQGISSSFSCISASSRFMF